jgi:hypothetical protein
VPTTLQQGELAVNITDKKMWVGNAATTPVQLLGGGADGNFSTITVTGNSYLATTSGNVGVGTSSPLGKIDASWGGRTASQVPALLVGANSDSTTRSNDTQKMGVIGAAHYTNAQSPVGLISSNSYASNNDVYLGGGFASINAATTLSFWTAANSTTTQGTERMRINSNGDLGIGVTSIGARLDVATTSSTQARFTRTGQTAVCTLYQSSSDTFLSATNSGASLILATQDTERMRINSSGNVGIGTSSPSVILDVKAPQAKSYLTSTTGTNTVFYSASNTGGSFYVGLDNSAGTEFGSAYSGAIYHSGAYPIIFYTGAAERMRIDSNGNLCLGTTSAGARLSIAFSSNSGPCIISNDTTPQNGNTFHQFRNNGTTCGSITSNGTTTTTYGTSSDYRLKENIALMTGALATVAQLKPVTYNWKVDGSSGQGFIAHELAEVCPDAVSGEKDAVNEDGSIKPQGIDTSFLVATLTAAIQELKAEFDAYKATHP